jgi:hypothetical protein
MGEFFRHFEVQGSIIIIHAVIIVCSFAECNTFELILKDNYVSYYCVLFVIIIFLSETPSLHRSESLRISELLASHLLQLDAVPLTGPEPSWCPNGSVLTEDHFPNGSHEIPIFSQENCRSTGVRSITTYPILLGKGGDIIL